MNVLLLADDLSIEPVRRHLIAQARLFRQRGDKVHLVLSRLPDSLPDVLIGILASPPTGSETDDAAALPVAQLYIYHHTGAYPLLASIKQRQQGMIFVHDHGMAPADWLPAHYADLCLVDDAQRRSTLLDDWGLAPERVHVLPDPGSAQYQPVLDELVSDILAGSWPLSPPLEDLASLQQPATELTAGDRSWDAALNLARSQADVMQRDYRVRSRIPLLGGAIAWLRRNLTSHLREPYLDPTLERQVAFNQAVVDQMAQVGVRLEALDAQLQAMQDRSSTAAPADNPGGSLPEEESDAG